MKFDRAYRDLSQLNLGVVGVFCILSLVLVGSYLYIDYQRYLSSYQITQQSELKTAQEKINSNVENIKKLSALTVKRISASSGNIQRIQNILTSAPSLLPDRDLLKLQKVTYAKHSHPQCLITRLGVTALESDKSPWDMPDAGRGPSILFDQQSVYSKTHVFTPEGQLDGILEIHVPLSHFKETLKMNALLSFVPSSAHVLFQKEPFPIYGKLPEPFWGYFSKNLIYYTLFFLFMLFTLIFIILSNAYCRFRTKQTFQEDIKGLKDELSETQAEKKQVNDDLLLGQKQTETHQVTCQFYKQFQARFLHHQREQLHHVLRSIDVVLWSLQNPNASLPAQERIDILRSCLKVVENAISGSLSTSKHESVKIIKILNDIRSLFTEKMYKSDLIMELHCPENLIYYGDPLVLEFILLNLIGKPVYMAPKKGKVEIWATAQKEGLHIQVKDKGFAMNEKSQKQIQQAFNFFIPNELLQQLCRDNGFFYEYTKEKVGLNTVEILFPNVEEESLNNVIPLFNKN